MRDIFLSLGLIYGMIASLCFVAYLIYNYYSKKTAWVREQRIKKQQVETKSIALQKSIEIIQHPQAIVSAPQIKHSETKQETALDVIKNDQQITGDIAAAETKQNEFKQPASNKKIPVRYVQIQYPPGSTVQSNEALKPQLNFFEQSTKKGKGLNSGLIKTTFYFGSEDGFYIIDPKIDIVFTTRFDYISAGITGSVMIAPENITKQSLDNNTRFSVTTNLLQAGNYIFIQAISKQELQIADLKISPIDSLHLPALLQRENKSIYR